MGKVDFKYDSIELTKNIAEFGAEINKSITLTTDFGATKGVAAMKTGAPWTDRTGNARTGLSATPSHSGTSAIGFATHQIVFAHAMNYGIWLEIANSGKYQIIMPVLLQTGKAIMDALDAMFNNLGLPPEAQVVIDIPTPSHGTSQDAGVKAKKQARTAKRGAKSQTTRRMAHGEKGSKTSSKTIGLIR